jgi:hypothetical protein
VTSTNLSQRIEALLGSAVVAMTATGSGYTRAGASRISIADGRSAFVKHASDEPTAASLRAEATVISELAGRFAPHLLAWEDGPEPLLIVEDLSSALWPPPYPRDTKPLFEALHGLQGVSPPASLPRLAPDEDRVSSWERVGVDPAPLLGLGLCRDTWLERWLPALVAAEREFQIAGDALCHFDVYAANLCFTSDRGVLFVDWGGASIGNPDVDVAFAAISILSERGALPAKFDLPEAAIAWVAGHFALEAPEPLPAWAKDGATLRIDQVRDLRAALELAARTLGLDAP